MQKSEHHQIQEAIWSWDVSTVETLINTRYIDVNITDEVSTGGSIFLKIVNSVNNIMIIHLD